GRAASHFSTSVVSCCRRVWPLLASLRSTAVSSNESWMRSSLDRTLFPAFVCSCFSALAGRPNQTGVLIDGSRSTQAMNCDLIRHVNVMGRAGAGNTKLVSAARSRRQSHQNFETHL